MCYRTEKNIYVIIYLGDLMDEENVLDFLTSLEAMDLPDRIEEVNAKILSKIVEETDFVAVLFCKSFFSLYTLIIKLSLSQKHIRKIKLFETCPTFILSFSIKYRACKFRCKMSLRKHSMKYICEIFLKSR